MSVCISSYNTHQSDQQLVVWSAGADCCIGFLRCITQQCVLGMLQERHECLCSPCCEHCQTSCQTHQCSKCLDRSVPRLRFPAPSPLSLDPAANINTPHNQLMLGALTNVPVFPQLHSAWHAHSGQVVLKSWPTLVIRHRRQLGGRPHDEGCLLIPARCTGLPWTHRP